MLKRINLLAGQGFQIRSAGKLFRLISLSDYTAKLDIQFYNGAGNELEPVENAPKGLRYQPPEGFSALRFFSDKALTLTYIITDGWADVDLNLDGAKVLISNDCNAPVPITTCSGVPLDVNVENWPTTITQPNGCDDALHVEVCPPKFERHACEKLTIAPLSQGGSIVITPTGKIARWQIRNTGTEPIVIEPDNGNGVATGYGVILLDPDEWWAETDNPDWQWLAYSQTSPVVIFVETLSR